MSSNRIQIFESHSKLDEQTCDLFDKVVARVGIKAFRSEYEDIKAPAWETIKDEMKRSSALFLLVGPELVKAQAKSGHDWKFTQNWIAYEVGLACALDIDVWVECNDTIINFPVPYLNNYVIGKIQTNAQSFERSILDDYCSGKKYPFGSQKNRNLTCPNEGCAAKYNFYNTMPKGSQIVCPTCLKYIAFPEGWGSVEEK
jgi:hypothetical protein